MYITVWLYINITFLLWVLSIYPSIKHYTIVVSIRLVSIKQKLEYLHDW